MNYAIPKKIRKKVGKQKGYTYYLHYNLIKIYDNIVLYECEENGTKESFNKKDFIKHDID